MACYFFDIDGTLTQYHTGKWLPGAKEYLEALSAKGHQIVFITMRSNKRDAGKEWSEEKTAELLSELSFSYTILHDCKSPRIIKRKQNSDWWEELKLLERS